MPKVKPIAADVALACRANVTMCLWLDPETPGEVLAGVLASDLPGWWCDRSEADCAAPFNRLLERVANSEAGCSLLVVQEASGLCLKDIAVTHVWICINKEVSSSWFKYKSGKTQCLQKRCKFDAWRAFSDSSQHACTMQCHIYVPNAKHKHRPAGSLGAWHHIEKLQTLSYCCNRPWQKPSSVTDCWSSRIGCHVLQHIH